LIPRPEARKYPTRLPPDLPSDFASLSDRERLEIVDEIARPRSDRATAKQRIVHMHEDGDSSHAPALTLVLEADPDRLVKRAATFGLACIPDRLVLGGLRVALALPDRASKGHAIIALGRLRAREAVPDLIELLDERYGRIPAADALVAIGDDRALLPLRRAVADARLLTRRRLQKRVHLLEARVRIAP
jgi:HEAT repeat protein